MNKKKCEWCERIFSFDIDKEEPDLCDNCAKFPSYFEWLKATQKN